MSNMFPPPLSLNSPLMNDKVKNDLKKEADLERSTCEISEMFFRSCLSQMFEEENTESGSFFGEGHAGQMWKHLFINEISKSCNGKTGLEGPLKKSLAKQAYGNIQKVPQHIREGAYATA
jgi:hypothetical protein